MQKYIYGKLNYNHNYINKKIIIKKPNYEVYVAR